MDNSVTISSSAIMVVLDLASDRTIGLGYGFFYVDADGVSLTWTLTVEFTTTIPAALSYNDTNLQPGTINRYLFLYSNGGDDIRGDILTICTGDKLSHSKSKPEFKYFIKQCN